MEEGGKDWQRDRLTDRPKDWGRETGKERIGMKGREDIKFKNFQVLHQDNNTLFKKIIEYEH